MIGPDINVYLMGYDARYCKFRRHPDLILKFPRRGVSKSRPGNRFANREPNSFTTNVADVAGVGATIFGAIVGASGKSNAMVVKPTFAYAAEHVTVVGPTVVRTTVVLTTVGQRRT